MHCIRLIFKWRTVFLLQQFLHHKLLNSRDPQRFLCCLIYHLGGDEKNYGPCQPFIINSQTKQEFCLTIRFNLVLRFKINLSQTNGAFFFPWLSDMKIFNLFLFLWSVLCVQDIYLHLKVVAKLRLIWQSSFCKKGCLQMSRVLSFDHKFWAIWEVLQS